MLVDCTGFKVVDHMTGEITVTVWFDKDGAPTRVLAEHRGQHELRNSVTSVAVTSNYHRRFMTDVEAGRTHIVGPAYTVTVPGHGAVMFETGVIVFENGGLSHMAGRHDSMNGGLDRLCPAFA